MSTEEFLRRHVAIHERIARSERKIAEGRGQRLELEKDIEAVRDALGIIAIRYYGGRK